MKVKECPQGAFIANRLGVVTHIAMVTRVSSQQIVGKTGLPGLIIKVMECPLEVFFAKRTGVMMPHHRAWL
jgi:hypothetical protein